jgi:hypothetical protein
LPSRACSITGFCPTDSRALVCKGFLTC